MRRFHIQEFFISIVVLCGYFYSLEGLLSGRYVPPEYLKDAVMMLLGALAGSISTILAFWVGSSRGSRDKDSPR